MPAPPMALLRGPRPQQLPLPFADLTAVPRAQQQELPPAVAASVRPRTIWRTLSAAQQDRVRQALLDLAAALLREEQMHAELPHERTDVDPVEREDPGPPSGARRLCLHSAVDAQASAGEPGKSAQSICADGTCPAVGLYCRAHSGDRRRPGAVRTGARAPRL